MKKINTIHRIKEYIDYKCLTIKDFELSVGFSNGAFGSQLKNDRTIGVDKLENILNVYNEINPDWLLTGKGSMLREPVGPVISTGSVNSIPLIPIEAIAGKGNNGEIQIKESDIIDGYVIPEFTQRGVEYIIRVSGSSMYPKYSSGDLLGCKSVKDTSFFQWGKIYVLDTDQGPMVKRLFPTDREDCLECRSDNKEYPPFIIYKSSIYNIAIVVGVLRLE
jgi:phage repressor protein C with HTH and peptisase S24 domain